MSAGEERRNTRAWIVRAGRNGAYEDLALAESVAVIGWSELGPLEPDVTRDELKQRIRETFGEARAQSIARQAGQVYRFVHELEEGDVIVLPLRGRERSVAIGRLTGPFEYRTDGRFQDVDAQYVRPVRWLGEIPYAAFDRDLVKAFGQQGTVSEVGGPDAAGRLLEPFGVEAARPATVGDALHLLLRIQPSIEPRTLELHEDVVAADGAVWFAKFSKSGDRNPMGDAQLKRLRDQLAGHVPTYVFVVGDREARRTRLLAVQRERPVDESRLIPSYYDRLTQKPVLWLKLTEFEPMPFDHLDQELVRDSAPEPGSVAKALGGQGSMLYVRALVDPSLPTPANEPDPPARVPFTTASVRTLAEAAPYGLRLDDKVYAAVVAALKSGKHVILTGPPGTAKTTLAQAVAEAARQAGLCKGTVLTTATADWTTYETIGGLRPNHKGSLEFEPGHFLEAIEQEQWLVIDELNRSQFDRAFGQLFTVLSGQPVTLPYKRPGRSGRLTLVPAGARRPETADVLPISPDWRIVATMNVFDKSLLFEMSYALMRRFAFIEVRCPEVAVFERLIEDWTDSPVAQETAKALLPLREIKDVGPAVYGDVARFAAARAAEDGEDLDGAELRFQAFYSYLLPQFEGIPDDKGQALRRELSAIVGSSHAARVHAALTDVLGLQLGSPAGADNAD